MAFHTAVSSGQEEEHVEEDEHEEMHAGPSRGKMGRVSDAQVHRKKKKAKEMGAAGADDTGPVKGKAKAKGRAAVKQAEEEKEQSAAGSEEDDEEVEARPSGRNKGAAPARQKQRKPGDTVTYLPILSA